MLTDPSLTLADQIAWLVALFLRTMAAEAHARRVGTLSGALWNRVRRLERRFLALHAMWKAGTLPAARGGGAAPRRSLARVEGAEAAAMTVRPASLLPRGLWWMRRLLP